MPKTLQHLTSVKNLRDWAKNEIIKKWEAGFSLTCMVGEKMTMIIN